MAYSNIYSDEQLSNIARRYFAELESAKTLQELEAIRVTYLGRSGLLATLMADLKKLSIEDKRRLGPEYNTFKEQAQAACDEKIRFFTEAQQTEQLQKRALFDVTAYRPGTLFGSLHPHTHVIEELEDVLTSMGFEVLEGPEVETEEVNFEALNIPHDHPARDMQDTFWLTSPHTLLRTHTSTVQIRGMRSGQPPLAIASLGRAYRNEATDASHDVVFMQFEGLLIDKKVSMAHLFATMKTLLQILFKKDELAIRIRPSYFPFVEPAVEIDMQCPFCTEGCPTCKRSRWIEICGAGLIHPHVLKAGNINPAEYSGFAFGFGLTRLVMLKYGINDVRLLHSGKIEFLKQF